MIARVARWTAAVLPVLVSLAWAGDARGEAAPAADLAAEADLHFELGVEDYQAGRYREALEHLLLSNRLGPNKNVVFNIARCFESLGRYDQAYRYYAEYLDMETVAEGRDQADAAMERLAPLVALVEVSSEPEGAAVYVDRRDLGARGRTPLVLALSPGSHRVLLELPGFVEPEPTEVELVAGARAPVRVALERVVGSVRVEGEPEGATVRVDSEDSEARCSLPCSLDLTPGPHVVIVAAPDREAVQRVVTVGPGAVRRLRVALRAQRGSLVVSCLDEGARVSLDGREIGRIGRTALTIPDIPVGPHELRVSLEGFQGWEREVTVTSGEVSSVEVELRALREVTAASRALEAVSDAPASVTIVTEEEIRAFGFETLYEALGGVRGLFQSDDRTYQLLGFRGFARPGDYGSRVLVTVDGHAVNDDQVGAGAVGSERWTDLLDVERIEVVRGPGSALYGTNAFFGVINVVTRSRLTLRPPHVSIAASGDRTARLSVGGGHQFGRRFGFWASASGVMSQGDDFYFPEYDDGATSDGQARGLDGFVSGSASARLWLDDLTLEGSYTRRAKHFATAQYGTLFGDDRALVDDSRAFVELRYEPVIRDRLRLSLRSYLDWTGYRGRFPYPIEDGGLLDDAWDGLWVGGEARGTLTLPTWSLRLTMGAEVQAHILAHLYSRTEADEEPFLDEHPIYQVYSGYVDASARPLEWLSFALGLRYDYFAMEGFPSPSLDSWSPHGALLFRLTDRDLLKVMGGMAFRAPTPYEFFYNDGGISQVQPEGLGPETIITAETEYSHRFTEEVSLLGAVYFNVIESLIETVGLPPDFEVFAYANSEEAVQTLGAELELRREWHRGWMLSAVYSHQRSRYGNVFADDDGEGASTRLTNSPEHLVGIRGVAPIVRNAASIASQLRVTSPRATLDPTVETDWAVLWDVVLSGRIPAAHFEYAIGVRNLLDWRCGHSGGPDMVMLSVPQPGRTFFASATLTW